jgi:hypothetical protein
MTRIRGTLYEVLYTFMIISRLILLRKIYVSDKICRENQNTFYVQWLSFWKSCRLCDNVEIRGTARRAADDNIFWRMRFACWMTQTMDKHSEHVIVTAFLTTTNVTRTRFNFTFTITLSVLFVYVLFIDKSSSVCPLRYSICDRLMKARTDKQINKYS